MIKKLLITAICLQSIAAPAQAQIYTTTTTTVESPEPQPYCREYTQTLNIGGTEQKAYGTACQQPDGSWELQPKEDQNNLTGQVIEQPAPPPVTYIVRENRLYYMPPSPFIVYDYRNGRKYPHHSNNWNNGHRDNDHRDNGHRDNDNKDNGHDKGGNNENYGNNNPHRR